AGRLGGRPVQSRDQTLACLHLERVSSSANQGRVTLPSSALSQPGWDSPRRIWRKSLTLLLVVSCGGRSLAASLRSVPPTSTRGSCPSWTAAFMCSSTVLRAERSL